MKSALPPHGKVHCHVVWDPSTIYRWDQRSPAWLAKRKGFGRVPKVDGQLAARATPERTWFPAQDGVGGLITISQGPGSGSVVLDGVTTVQGARESLAQGKGT